MEDIYIVVLQGGYFGSVTICEPSRAARMAQQLRQGGRKIKIFRKRDDYLTALEKDYKERHENIRLQTRCGGYK